MSDRGTVYLATADGYRPDYLKIGFTLRHTTTRMKELDSNSGQGAKGYRILARVYAANPQLLEGQLHTLFARDRQDSRREWFNNMSIMRFYEGVIECGKNKDLQLLLKRLAKQEPKSIDELHTITLLKDKIYEYEEKRLRKRLDM